MSQDKKVKMGIVIGMMIFLVAICIVVIVFQNKSVEQEPNSQPLVPLSMTLVDEYSTFFALVNVVNEYFRYIKQADSEAVYSVLYSKFISENQLTQANVLDMITLEDSEQFLQASNIYYQAFGENYLYLVEGSLIVNEFEENRVIDDDFQIFVIVDYSTFSFAISPITNSEELLNPLSENQISIVRNNYNRMQTSGVITTDYICSLYYADFTGLLFDNINDSYSLLSDSFKQRYSLISYVSYMSPRLTSISSKITDCNVDYENEKRIYTIIDENSNRFTFLENSIMNYRVEFAFNTV